MDHIMTSYGSRKLFFLKVLGIVFDPKSLSIDLLVMVPDFFEITFDRFFFRHLEMVQNGQKWSKKVKIKKLKKGQKKIQGGTDPRNACYDLE